MVLDALRKLEAVVVWSCIDEGKKGGEDLAWLMYTYEWEVLRLLEEKASEGTKATAVFLDQSKGYSIHQIMFNILKKSRKRRELFTPDMGYGCHFGTLQW